MKRQNVPDTPQDLQHPGRLAMDAANTEPAAPQPQVAAGSEQEDDTPIFDDPVIGWWENAWSLRDDPKPL